MARFLHHYIRESNGAKLKRRIRLYPTTLTGIIRQFHPTDIRTVSRRLRYHIIMEHTLRSRFINADFTRLIPVDIGFVFTSSQISYMVVCILHFECQPQAGH